MTCSVCQVKGHNKRRCPNKEIAFVREPAPKRPRGRPRNVGQPPRSRAFAQSASQPTTSVQPQTANQMTVPSAPSVISTYTTTAHHNATAQPSLLSSGGRMIRGCKGSKGGRSSSAAPEHGSSGTRGRGGEWFKSKEEKGWIKRKVAYRGWSPYCNKWKCSLGFFVKCSVSSNNTA